MQDKSLHQKVIKLLKQRPEQQCTAKQIAELIYESDPEKSNEKLKRSLKLKTKEDLIDQYTREIGARVTQITNDDSSVKITADRPRKFYYSNKSDAEEIAEVEQNKDGKFFEKDIYPLLCKYLYSQLGLYPKRIDEKTSSNKRGLNGNKWLHPDIVGIKNLSENWNKSIKEYAKAGFFTQVNLWSFEVKIKINNANVRECFFQTVSNSSWAHFAYLVGVDIMDNVMEELRILCSAHNIGVIKFDKDNISESQIIIPASKREKVDLDMMNRILTENKDFEEYIERIKEFYHSGRLVKADWGYKNN